MIDIGRQSAAISLNDALIRLVETGHRPVAAGDAPAALRAPGTDHLVRKISLPKLGGKLPPRTAKLAVPP